MVRFSVPIDVGTVGDTACAAFALVTPLRVERLLELAVLATCGKRAPQDKRERAMRSMRDGLRTGRFVVDVDGRLFSRLDDVVVCAGQVTLRFFSAERRRVVPDALT